MFSNVSRRSFVAGSAALAGIAASGIQLSFAHAEEAAQEEFDVLVIGGGISGSIAALAAVAEGAQTVALVEKQGFIGGSAALSSGFMVTVENENFDDVTDDSLETTMATLMAVHNQSPHKDYPTDRLEYVFSRQSETIDFMLSMGMTAEFGAKSTAVTMWDGKGAGMMEALANLMDEKGVDVRLNTPAQHLLVDDAGAVCGAEVEGKDGAYSIAAKKVILACGGASHDDAILQSYLPTIADVQWDNQACPGDAGDGFRMGEEIGAQFYPSLVLEGGGVTINRAWKNETEARPSTADKLSVDAQGARYMNEGPDGSGSGQMNTYYMVDHGSSAYYFIYDASDADFAAALDAGVEGYPEEFFYGETPEALAEAAGMDVATFVAAFDAYQAACEAGEDAEFGKNPEKLVAYQPEGGLYAVFAEPGSWGTIGGIKTDYDGHAFDQNDKLIPNLWAVGEMSNREFFSDFYVGGNSLATSSTMGRLAAIAAVAEL